MLTAATCVLSGNKTGLLAERRGTAELLRLHFLDNDHSIVSNGAGAFVRTIDCTWDVEPLQQGNGVVVREDGIAAMFDSQAGGLSQAPSGVLSSAGVMVH